MREFIVLLSVLITLLASSLFELTVVSNVLFWLVASSIAVYVGLVLFNPKLLISITEINKTAITYINTFTYCLLIAYYLFISEHKLSIYLGGYLIITLLIRACITY